jgi:hypothetical protein
LSWDEYPFASSEQGGRPGVTIWPVPIWENHLQGGIIIGSYYLENIKYKDEFAVVIVP